MNYKRLFCCAALIAAPVVIIAAGTITGEVDAVVAVVVVGTGCVPVTIGALVRIGGAGDGVGD